MWRRPDKETKCRHEEEPWQFLLLPAVRFVALASSPYFPLMLFASVAL